MRMRGKAGGLEVEKSIRIGQGTEKSSVGMSQRKEKELLPVVINLWIPRLVKR